MRSWAGRLATARRRVPTIPDGRAPGPDHQPTAGRQVLDH